MVRVSTALCMTRHLKTQFLILSYRTRIKTGNSTSPQTNSFRPMRWMAGTRQQGKRQRLTMPLPSSTPSGLRSNYSSRHSNPNWQKPTPHRQSQPTQAKVRKLSDNSGAVRQFLPENQTNPYKKLQKVPKKLQNVAFISSHALLYLRIFPPSIL